MHRVGIRTYDTIHPSGLGLFGPHYEVGPAVEEATAILVRSHRLLMHEVDDTVVVVGRAGAGTDNIPVDELTRAGIPVLNTPGGNANAVAELVANAWGSVYRNIRQAQKFVHDLDPNDPDYRKKADAGKRQFAGNEVRGKKMGIIGLGSIGGIVAQLALDAGMVVVGYDPYLSVQAALKLPNQIIWTTNLASLLRQCDLVSLHLPLTPSTVGFIGADELGQMKWGAVLLNYAREDLVRTGPLLEALKGRLRHYATDFPMPDIHRHPRVSATPHLGASTEESEETCAVRLAEAVLDFMEQGGIRNSVNFPAIALERQSPHRLVILHANEPMMSAQITSIIGAAGLNIVASIDTTREGTACSLMDIETPVTPELKDKISAVPGVYRVNYLQRADPSAS